jgi:outer membrane protein TolC
MTPRACLPGLLSFVCAARLGAQQPLTLQLRDAVALAQERGYQARAAAASRDAARYRARAFSARLLPQLSLGGIVPNYSRAIIPVVQPDGSTLFVPQHQTNASLNLLLTQKLPLIGGDLFVSSALARVAVAGEQSLETWSSTPVAIGVQQDIFRPNVTAWDGREQAARSELAERQYLEDMENVALGTSEAFFDVYTARVALDNAEKNAAVNDTLYKLNTGRLEVGKIGENDLLQSELALVRARTTLESARLDYDRAVDALRLVLAVPGGTPLQIVVTTTLPEFEADTARAVAEALRNRAALSDAALQDVLARRRVAEARLSSGVGATVSASFGLNATAPQASLVYQHLLEARQFTLAVQVPLVQWGARKAGVEAAEADRERVTNAARATQDLVAHDAYFAALQLAQARRTVALLAKADTVGAKRFEVAYNRYVIGRIALDNLYIAQTEKDQAVAQFAQALRAYWEAYYRLRRLTLFDFETGRPIR